MTTVHLLGKAYDTAPETTRYSLFTRAPLPELATRGPAMLRNDVRELAGN